MSTWGDTAQKILDAMVASGVKVDRQLIGGPLSGRRCSQFLVYADFPLSTAQATAFQQLPAVSCGRVQPVLWRAVYTKDCAPGPTDSGGQPDARATTAWFTEFLDDCEKIVDEILDAFADVGITINPGQFTGPTGKVASMSYALVVAPSLDD